jgi:methylglutaconyl-CoA hydratase
MSHSTTVRAHRDEAVLTLTIHRPEKRNALNVTMIEELTRALDAAAHDTSCKVVVLTGAGETFCAGMDLEHLEALGDNTPAEHRADTGRIAWMLRMLYDLPKPTIAAVNGVAVAGGMGLATICDFTLAVPEAKFGYTEVKIGFVPAIVSVFLRRQIGDKHARDLLLTGRLIKAQEAFELGLVTRVVPEPELMREAHALAKKLLDNSPQAMQATKRLLSEQVGRQLDEEIEAAIAANVGARTTEDFREGIRAFLEKRKPNWASRHTRSALPGD